MSDTKLQRLTKMVQDMVCLLVDDEDRAEVEVVAERFHTNFIVKVAPNDFGKVVGSRGHNVEALRTVIKAAGSKLGLPTCAIHVEDPNPKRLGERG